MDLVFGVIDIQQDGLGRLLVRGDEEVDKGLGDAIQIAPGNPVFEPAHRGLTGQIRTGDRQAVARRLEGRILAQRMAIVGILIPTGYLKHALMDQVRQRVLYIPWVPTVAYRLDDAI